MLVVNKTDHLIRMGMTFIPLHTPIAFGPEYNDRLQELIDQGQIEMIEVEAPPPEGDANANRRK